MDSLQNFVLSHWVIVSFTSVFAVIIAIAMGSFSSKNHMPVDGRTVLLTGASEGMGRSAAIQLSAKGANIILVSRNKDRLKEAQTAAEAAAKSPTQRFLSISADVAEHGYAARVVAEATAWNGGAAPDIVWCVAGMSTPMLWAEDADSMAAARRNMDVNYFGAAEMSRAILREWLAPVNRAGPGAEPKHIVFTASVLALLAIVGYGPYTPSKWALRGLADTLAMELRLYPDHPVRVHVVYPATITSPGLERENVTKPEVTVQMEKDEPPETPDTVARRSIAGLEKGRYFVTVSFLGELMRCAVMGGSERNSWVLDSLLGWIMPIVYFFVTWDLNGQVSKYAKKNGHPSTYSKKD